jgi:integrase/recombinase XerD
MTHHVHQYLLPTRSGGKVSVRNIERDFKTLFKQIGIEGVRASPHTIRHSFAVCYLRNGGNLEFLRRILGHSSLITTQKYLRSLGVEDLAAVHNSLSPLARR